MSRGSPVDGLPPAWRIPLAHGFSTIPLRLGSKLPVGRWRQFQTKAPTLDQVKGWAKAGHNVGIVTGEVSDIVVLDLDSEEAIAEANRRGLPVTVTVRTPRGLHCYFLAPGWLIKNAVHVFDGADIRADGGYVVGPGSTYRPTLAEQASGRSPGEYRWVNSPDDVPLAAIPKWLECLLANGEQPERTTEPSLDEASVEIEALLRSVTTAPQGRRNHQLNRAAFLLAQRTVSDLSMDGSITQAKLTQAALEAGLDTDEIGPTIRSGWTAGLREAEIDATEDGIAQHFSRTVGTDFIYDPRVGSWYYWDDAKWARVPRDHVIAELRCIARAAGKTALRKASASSGAELLARSDPAHRLAGEWNHDPFLLGTPEGVVDLRTGLLREANSADLVTKHTSVGPDPGNPTLWNRFLSDATGADPSLMDFLQRLCGYALTGDIREQCLFFVYGQGGNGKSVFLNTLRAILGDHAVVSPIDMFEATAFAKHPTEIAMLAGARLVCASETARGKAWDEVRIKQLTGGDPITARYMRCDFFTFEPTFKLIIVGNHKPDLREVDDALRRRIFIVPFTQRPAIPDLELEHKLRTEHGQILAWMIEGCRQWVGQGLDAPAAVRAATKEYFAEQDGMARWIEDRCEIASDLKTPPNELFNNWSHYALEMGFTPMSSRAFGDAILRQGFERLKTNGVRYFAGIGLKPERFV